ncbi:hypothetical protein [Desulfosarcina cetonica]|uniref:hypothetical protein n=1 Tax=Desulfosarcina cetonica TaxID=90730 RepID=UPI0006D2AB14|nr:hypothetical protein [Desulfosarcina cetonica]
MQSLESFYQSDLLPDLEKLEAQRLIVKKKLVQAIVIFVALNLAFLFVHGLFGLNLYLMVWLMFIILSALFTFFSGTSNTTGTTTRVSKTESSPGSSPLSTLVCGMTKWEWCPGKHSRPVICLTTSPENTRAMIW